MKKCPECDKFQNCKQLCEEVENYIKSSTKSSSESVISSSTEFEVIEFDDEQYCDNKDKQYCNLSLIERNVVTLLIRGNTREEICQELGITRVYLRNIISRMKKKA